MQHVGRDAFARVTGSLKFHNSLFRVEYRRLQALLMALVGVDGRGVSSWADTGPGMLGY